MHILFLITKSEVGGAQTHVAQLAQFLIAQRHGVAIMSAPGGWLEKEAKKLGARFFPNPFLVNSANPLRLVKAGRCLIQAVRDFQPDILACHSTAAGLLGRFTIRNRIPTLFTAHGWGFTQGAPILRRVILPILERFAARFSSKIICVSQNDLRLAQRHHIAPKEKLVQIYNGVEIPHPITKQLSNRVCIFFIGRLAPPKDPIMLIKAVQHLPEPIRQRVNVTIIGDGPDQHNLASAIHDAGLDTIVELAGSLSRDKTIERLQCEADLFVLPTHWEGFPYSILEAMACGVPVIASNVGGIAEAVDATCGILVPPNDERALREALTSLITNPQQRRAMGEAGKEKASRIFSVQSMCQRTLVTYEEVL